MIVTNLLSRPHRNDRKPSGNYIRYPSAWPSTGASFIESSHVSLTTTEMDDSVTDKTSETPDFLPWWRPANLAASAGLASSFADSGAYPPGASKLSQWAPLLGLVVPPMPCVLQFLAPPTLRYILGIAGHSSGWNFRSLRWVSVGSANATENNLCR